MIGGELVWITISSGSFIICFHLPISLSFNATFVSDKFCFSSVHMTLDICQLIFNNIYMPILNLLLFNSKVPFSDLS